MKAGFPYEKENSRIFGSLRRPIARASFWSKKFQRFIDFTLIIDTGADYTLFPHSKALDLGINLTKDCREFKTIGIGGKEMVFLLPEIRMRLGAAERIIPVGFLKQDNIPPLLGRYKCLDTFSVLFASFYTTFSA
ncbi:hypothetical protein HZB07_01285 [Candidatus Saganbacteria bacterium]|nr:hypothetical protein [Candidatus Saganbacteria bacterium]